MGDDKIFYVHDVKGNAVEAKFLREEHGGYVTDPNTAKARATHIYDAAGKEIADANPNAYMIVPADYSLEHAVAYAKGHKLPVQMAKDFKHDPLNPVHCLEGAVAAPAMALFVKDFMRNGSEDLQRSYNGKEAAPFVPAFTDAASFHYGLVMSYTGICKDHAEEVGGVYNKRTANENPKAHIDTSGPHGLSAVNGHSIDAGYAQAEKVLQAEKMEQEGKPGKLIDARLVPPKEKQEMDRIKLNLNNIGITGVQTADGSPVSNAPGSGGPRSLA